MTVTDLGRQLMRGALVESAKWLWIGFVAIIVATGILSHFGYGWDATDDQAGRHHGQMRLRTDYGTGCQYLESAQGVLTPRLDQAGRQVCR